jgi:hypothetical protein
MPKIMMGAHARGNITVERGPEDDWPDYQHKYNPWTLRAHSIRIELRYQGGNAWRIFGGNFYSHVIKQDGTVGTREVREPFYGPGNYPHWAWPIVDAAVEEFTGRWADLLEEQN